jgi:nicotinate-nucleotide adenylyltransferase
VARAARDAFALDVVLFAPVGMQPLKPEGPAASFEDRVAMSRLAIAGESGFQLSLADAPRSPDAPKSRPDRASAPNFTIDTLEWLRTSLVPDCALFCLMGADSFFALRRWHRGAELPFVAPLIVASRPGQPLQDLTSALPPGLALEPAPEVSLSASAIEVRTFVLMNQAGDRAPFFVLPNLHVDISASEIRAQIHAAPGGLAAERDLVPSAVREYIAQHGLYRS